MQNCNSKKAIHLWKRIFTALKQQLNSVRSGEIRSMNTVGFNSGGDDAIRAIIAVGFSQLANKTISALFATIIGYGIGRPTGGYLMSFA